MTIQHFELQQLTPSPIVELYELTEFNPDNLEQALYFTNEKEPITFGDRTYQPMPVEGSGWEYKSGGTLPRPMLRVSNVGGVISSMSKAYDDLIGSKLVRRRTLAKYLDGQPNADPNAEFQPDIYWVQRKAAENKTYIEFELASVFDLEGMRIPRRRKIARVCLWRYRSAECGYAGGPVATVNDEPTGNGADDQCGKRLTSCKMRFGENEILNFGGFPGMRRL